MSQLEYCQQSYFITYNLGYQQTAAVKTVSGTAAHKTLEILSALKKYSQDNSNATTLTITDDAIGEVSVAKSELYKVTQLSLREISKINLSRAAKSIFTYDVTIPDNHTRIGHEFIEHINERSVEYYSSKFETPWTNAEKMFVHNSAWIPLELENKNYSPLFRTIVQPEQEFDIPILKDWAKFRYEINGEIIEGNFAIKGTIDLITELEPGVMETVDWKGLPVETPIPTLMGWSTMEELKIGDVIFDENGKQTKVLAKSKISKKRCFEIKFDDKTSAICDIEHLWKTERGVVNILDLKVGDNILVAKPLDIEPVSLPIDPYVLGMWLGDGRNRSGEITSGDDFIFDEIERRGFQLGVNQEKRPSKCKSRTVLGLTALLRPLNLLNNKHIPSIYLRASFAQRLDLLRGLMDSDGNVNVCRKQTVFTNCHKPLSDDVRELLLTLGLRPNQGSVISHGFGLVTQVYPIHFKPIHLNPFLLPRKANRVDQSWGNGLSYRRQVRSIAEVEERLTQCIMVDSPSSTFLCTTNMIPTHNTGKRYNWGTGKVKDYKSLCSDPQLMLYYFALKHLYGDKYPDISFTIYFIRDGGPFCINFDDSHIVEMEETLKKHFESVKSNYRPKMLDVNQRDFRCQKLCTFFKETNKFDDSGRNTCRFIHDEIERIGLKRTIELYKDPLYSINTYQSPGA